MVQTNNYLTFVSAKSIDNGGEKNGANGKE